MRDCHCIGNVVTKKRTGWRIGHKVHSFVSLHVRRKATVDRNVSIIDLILLKHDAQICREFYCFAFLHVDVCTVRTYTFPFSMHTFL